jgi:hypothetical protein
VGEAAFLFAISKELQKITSQPPFHLGARGAFRAASSLCPGLRASTGWADVDVAQQTQFWALLLLAKPASARGAIALACESFIIAVIFG